MGIPNVGNPIWVIEFTWRGTRGTIRNHYDKRRRTEFSNSAKLIKNLPDPRIDDYVLTLATI